MLPSTSHTFPLNHATTRPPTLYYACPQQAQLELEAREKARAAEREAIAAKRAEEAARVSAALEARLEAARKLNREFVSVKRAKEAERQAVVAEKRAEGEARRREEAARKEKLADVKAGRRVAALERTAQEQHSHAEELLAQIARRDAHIEKMKLDGAAAREEKCLREALKLEDKEAQLLRARRAVRVFFMLLFAASAAPVFISFIHSLTHILLPPAAHPQREYARLKVLSSAMAAEERNAFEAAEREKIRCARQAEQRRTLIAKSEMERELERLRLEGRKKQLPKDEDGPVESSSPMKAS